MALTPITDATFEARVLKSSKPVLVDFWADWCAPCKQLTPIIEELSKAYAGQVDFFSLDTNESPITPTKYGILNLPAVLFFSDGEVVKEIRGSVTKMTLRKSLNEVA